MELTRYSGSWITLLVRGALVLDIRSEMRASEPAASCDVLVYKDLDSLGASAELGILSSNQNVPRHKIDIYQ